DLDGDGALEIVVGSRDGWLYVLRADGSDQPGWPAPQQDFHVASPLVADLDGDGALDILSYAPQRRELSILRGDGAGFAPRVELAAPDSVAFALADLDGDGHDELLEVGDAGLRVRRVRDSPQLTTIRSAALAAPNARPLLRAGDIDGDGATDLLVANWRDAERASSREDPEFDYSSLWWLRGDGDGGFTSAEYARAPDRTGAALADLDGDGAAELIVSVPHELAVLGWRDEPGAFVELHAAASGSLEALRVVDLDRDGRLDVLGRDKRALVVLHGAGDLEFEPAIETAAIEATGAEVLGLVVADLDQDGALEVLTWVYGQPGLQRLRPRPDRRWSAPEELPTPGPVFGLDVGDLDQDGVLELALKVLEDDVYWWTQLELDEDGELRGPFVLRPANSGWRSRLVDWDADGRLDLLDHGDEFTILLLGADQRGDRLPNYTPARLPGAGALELVDLDHDGARDLALLNTSGALAVYLGGAP
ncbi:MAG: VCBS repeat-containing protein, partial [Myxococcales bacterium]|nr:VCBS repeat-containing protein [Myxococcales bacterium]